MENQRKSTPTVAFLANQFPSPVEPYVVEQVRELRARGIKVICCSVRRPVRCLPSNMKEIAEETLYIFPVQLELLLATVGTLVSRRKSLKGYWLRVVTLGKESPGRRVRALLHTFLGVYFSLRLKDEHAQHIHVHHGYFGSWIAMVAAKLLGIGFSITLHGSDLLLHNAYLDMKLKECKTCFTVSHFNRRYIETHYPHAASEKLLVHRLGVTPAANTARPRTERREFALLSVGRLHPVKDHAFLLRACYQLKQRSIDFRCVLAGEGPERAQLTKMIARLNLSSELYLLGHLEADRRDEQYGAADAVVLTSRSEGIPVVLMEAMARGKIVLAPNISGIPELVISGETGFLYQANSLDDFLSQLDLIRRDLQALDWMRTAARHHVLNHFNQQQNLSAFTDSFLSRTRADYVNEPHENSLLQQI